MSIECVICCEHLQSSEIIHHTPCGHVFHKTCLARWFERSKTCPECRQRVTASKVGRIYLNYSTPNNAIAEIASSLQSEIAGLNHELLIKEIELIETNSNNTKLSSLLKSKESEFRRLEADLWIAREHHRLWKNHAQLQVAAHDATRKEVSRLTKELCESKSTQTIANDFWNKVSAMFHGINDHETIIKKISESQSELMSAAISRYELERTVARLEAEVLRCDCADRMFSTEQQSEKRQLEEDLACSVIEKFALQTRVKELENKILNFDVKAESEDGQKTDQNEPARKKLKITETPHHVIDLTKDAVKILVDLTDDDLVIS